MKTFFKLFSGTLGIIFAVVFCAAMCLLSMAVIPIVFPITATP